MTHSWIHLSGAHQMVAPMRSGLTKREGDVVMALKAFERSGGRGPTYDELALVLGGTSRGNVARIVRQLERKGWVDRGTGHRAIRLRDRMEVFTCFICGGRTVVIIARTEEEAASLLMRKGWSALRSNMRRINTDLKTPAIVELG